MEFDSLCLQPYPVRLTNLLRLVFASLSNWPENDPDDHRVTYSNFTVSSQNPDPNESINEQAERLLTSYGDSILRLAYSYLHNMFDAEEVLQDTMIQFLKAHPLLENAQKEKAWILRVAGNLAKNRIRYNKVRDCDELKDTLLDGTPQDLAFVWDAVKNLPVKYREAIHLFYYEGYATAEIADILGRKESTVRSDLRRGRELLKKLLKEAYDFE